jgi:hypothetical protein
MKDKIIQNVVKITDIAKVRDKLIGMFERDKKKLDKYEEELDNSELKKCILDWVIEEVNDGFDFDGEEE